jgi:hypothetical protein
VERPPLDEIKAYPQPGEESAVGAAVNARSPSASVTGAPNSPSSTAQPDFAHSIGPWM